MRTTLSIDDDLAAILLRVRQTRKMSLKAIINEALRNGLQQLTAPRPRRGGLTENLLIPWAGV
jgi:hypothetical protein